MPTSTTASSSTRSNMDTPGSSWRSPDLVIIHVAIDDEAVCRLLSMLTLGPETSAIPIVTWTERFDGGGLDYFIPDARRNSSVQTAAIPMN